MRPLEICSVVPCVCEVCASNAVLALVFPTKWPAQDEDLGVPYASFELQFTVFAQPVARCKLVDVFLGAAWLNVQQKLHIQNIFCCYVVGRGQPLGDR